MLSDPYKFRFNVSNFENREAWTDSIHPIGRTPTDSKPTETVHHGLT